MKKVILLFNLVWLSTVSLHAQQDAAFTQYMDNQIYINPAYAGSHEYLNVTGIHRQQWVGFEGAPKTTTIAIHSPLKYKSIGLGMDVLSDQIGPIHRLSATADFAYRFHFKGGGKLSFGIKAGVDTYSGDLSALDLSGDDPLATSVSNVLTPTFGAGIYYFADRWFAGASVPRLTSNVSGSVGSLDDATHIFAIGGFILDISSKWKLRPSTQVRMAVGAPINADLTLTGIYADRFWLGATHRFGESFGGLIQFQVIDQLKIGYAADFPVNGIRGNSFGSHEIMLQLGLLKNNKGLISPRYF